MEGKARFVFPVIMTGIIVFVVSFLNVGFRVDFVALWLRAFFTGWPLAAVVAFFAIPYARRWTLWLVARIEGQKS